MEVGAGVSEGVLMGRRSRWKEEQEHRPGGNSNTVWTQNLDFLTSAHFITTKLICSPRFPQSKQDNYETMR